jgi:hypothetical protein
MLLRITTGLRRLAPETVSYRGRGGAHAMYARLRVTARPAEQLCGTMIFSRAGPRSLRLLLWMLDALRAMLRGRRFRLVSGVLLYRHGPAQALFVRAQSRRYNAAPPARHKGDDEDDTGQLFEQDDYAQSYYTHASESSEHARHALMRRGVQKALYDARRSPRRSTHLKAPTSAVAVRTCEGLPNCVQAK